jgi:predicted metal-dependent phosphoesterase TrpH
MLKADLHIHTKDDPSDNWIEYSAKELIDYAAKLNFDVLSIANHDAVSYDKKIAEYARKKRILLIPAVERTINGKHVLIYNITQKQADKVKSFEDIKKQKNAFIIAAHPYFPFFGMKKELARYMKYFDAIEYSFFWTKLINKNKKAVKIAAKFNKPIVSNSDAHHLNLFGDSYSLIDSKKDIRSIFEAIRKNKIKIKTKPLSNFEFFRIFIAVLISPVRRFFHKH